VSVITGGRRYSFNLVGSLVLFKDCYAIHDRHSFASSSGVHGPNAFVDCTAEGTFSDIGPHHRYATGQLYDRTRGGDMRAWDRGSMGSGHGWAGAFVTFWNVLVTGEGGKELTVENPTVEGTYNYAVGPRGDRMRMGAEGVGVGWYESVGLTSFRQVCIWR